MQPILYVDFLKQSSYKNSILISMMHKQRTYFSKKYSKTNKITLSKINRLSKICEKDNIKVVKYISKNVDIIKYDHFIFVNGKFGCVRVVRYMVNKGYHIYKIIEFNGYLSDVLLSYIARYGNIHCVKLLLEKGYRINLKDNDELWNIILDNNGFVPRTNERFGWVYNIGFLQMLKYEKIMIDDKILKYSVINESIKYVKYLLEKGFRVNDYVVVNHDDIEVNNDVVDNDDVVVNDGDIVVNDDVVSVEC